MSTPESLISLSDNDRELLKQVVNIVQNLGTRLSTTEENIAHPTSNLLNAFRQILQTELQTQLQAELQPIKAQIDRLERELKKQKNPPQKEILI